MTCLILDDEELSIKYLQNFVAKVPQLELKASFTDPDEAMLYLGKHQVDLIFLDIEMPNCQIDGLDFAKIMGPDQHYIFTTGKPEHALSSFEYNTIDFLCKPFLFERFARAVQKARQILEARKDEKAEADTFTYIRSEGKLQRIDFDELCWLESERNGIWLTTENGRYNTMMSIGDIEARLPKQSFARIHKSFIISLAKAETINKESVSVRRQGKLQEIPIGDAYRKDFITSLESKILKR